MKPKLQVLGDRAFVCTFPAPARMERQQAVWAVAEAAAQWPGVVDAVPGINNLTLVFDPLRADADALYAALDAAWQEDEATAAGDAPARGPIEIPVVYGGEDGPDLDDVARHAGLSADEVVRLHGAADYVVYCLGFQPGFAYLGGLDPRLATPRRATPRVRVPAGSVAIGGAQTAVYPAASPGGWNLIGRATVALFDPASSAHPTLLRPGDHVRFVPARRPA